MHLIPDRGIEKELKRYCKDLFLQWNNKKFVWEVWISMPHGERLVTPIQENIFDVNARPVPAPPDWRLLKWIYQADTKRKDIKDCQSIKYRCDKAKRDYFGNIAKGNEKSKKNTRDMLAENYYILNDSKYCREG